MNEEGEYKIQNNNKKRYAESRIIIGARFMKTPESNTTWSYVSASEAPSLASSEGKWVT